MLNGVGVPAERATPGEKITAITQPVAAVSRKGADLEDNSETVLITMLCPSVMGAKGCEESAMEVANVLAAEGISCTVGECQFDGRTGLFCVEVTARLEEEAVVEEDPRVEIALEDTQLACAVSFTAWRTVDENTPDLADAVWNFQLEEFVPLGSSEETDPEEPFDLVLTSGSVQETYGQCVWIYEKRVSEGSGTRKLRTGIAGSRTVTT